MELLRFSYGLVPDYTMFVAEATESVVWSATQFVITDNVPHCLSVFYFNSCDSFGC